MIFNTTSLGPLGTGNQFQDYQIYNGLDCCLTHEIFTEIHKEENLLYDFERAMQAPALEMMLRGLRVEILARDSLVRHLQEQQSQLRELLGRYGLAVWDKPIEPRSPKLKDLFYDVMGLPIQYNFIKGQRIPSVNRDCLEKLEDYFHARPIIKAILAFRDLSKQIEFLTQAVDRDQRLRTSYNVAGAETGRWSSSGNAFGTGGNFQNYPDKLRRIFIADEGRKLAYVDLSQAESWIVGIRAWLVSGHRSYLDAIQSGDLHTTVSRMVWRDRPWTGNLKEDRILAEQTCYRDYSFRDLAKRGGHGTNYYGKPFTMAKHLKVDTPLMERFQDAYFTAFPEIPQWHLWVAHQLQLHQHITTFLGRERHFFGRPNDDATLREAIAHEPQSVVGDLLNLCAYRIWKSSQQTSIRLLAQLHDAVLIDYPDDNNEAHYITLANNMMRVPLNIGGETFVIPNDAATGWNWGKFDPDRNPGGVKKFSSKDPETRPRPKTTGLDRVIPEFH